MSDKQETILTKSNGVGLFASPGCGKSLMAVSLITLSRASRVLVICPTSVVGVWPREFERHSKEKFELAPLRNTSRKTPMSVAEKARAAEKAIDYVDREEKKLVMVVNYESAWRAPLADILKSVEWDMIVLDESHKIKSNSSTVSKFCRELATLNPKSYRLALTGTPSGGSCLDFYPQISFLNTSVFGTNYTAYQRRYTIQNKFGQQKEPINQKDLRRRLDSVSFTATEEVLKDSLPDKTESIKECPVSGEALGIYDAVESGMWAELESAESEAVLARVIIVQLQRCAQIVGGHVGGVINKDNPNDDPKVRRIKGASKLDTLKEIIEGKPKEENVVVFARFREELEMIRELGESMGLNIGEISGSRKDALTPNSEMKPGIDLCIVQTASGNAGIDLTAANHCVYYSLPLSLIEYDQSTKRCWRPGQEKTTHFYFLVAPDTVDEKIYNSLMNKQEITEYFKQEARRRQASE